VQSPQRAAAALACGAPANACPPRLLPRAPPGPTASLPPAWGATRGHRLALCLHGSNKGKRG
jgi:hypothetical protein